MKRFRCALVVCAALWIGGGRARGGVPELMTYQGRLMDGSNAVNGVVSMVLRVYTNETGGAYLYEDSNTVTVVDGLYSTYLGDDTTYGQLADALRGGEAYLATTVNGEELLPRKRIAAIAYALICEEVVPGGVTAEMLAPNAVDGVALAPGSVGVDHLDTASVDQRYVNLTGDTLTGNLTAGALLVPPPSGRTVWVDGVLGDTVANGATGLSSNDPVNSLSEAYAVITNEGSSLWAMEIEPGPVYDTWTFSNATLTLYLFGNGANLDVSAPADHGALTFGAGTYHIYDLNVRDSNDDYTEAVDVVGDTLYIYSGSYDGCVNEGLLTKGGTTYVLGGSFASEHSGAIVRSGGECYITTNVQYTSLSGDPVTITTWPEDACTLADARIKFQGSPSMGRVGIGTLTPSTTLEVVGEIYSTQGGFKFPDGSVQTTAATTPGSGDITSEMIADGAVQSNHIAGNAVTGGKIADGSISHTDLGPAAVQDANIAPNAVTGDKIANASIDSSHLVTGAVLNEHIGGNAVTGSKIAANSITPSHLTANAVTGEKIADHAVTATKIAAGSISSSHLATAAVQNSDIANGAVSGDKIAANSISPSHLTANAVTGEKIAANAVTGDKIAGGSISSTHLATAAVENSDIANGAVSGDKIAANSISSSHLVANAVTGDKIADHAVTSAKIATGSVSTTELNTGSTDDRYVNRTGDTMSGRLVVPWDGLEVAGRLVVTNGNVGLGVSQPQTELHIYNSSPEVRLDAGYSGGPATLALRGAGDAWYTGAVIDYTDNRGAGGLTFCKNGAVNAILTRNGDLGIGTYTPTAKLQVVGLTRTTTLHVTEGSDLAEPFPISSGLAEPGTVVCIDPAHPGKARRCEQEYDRTVLGVISGAGGLNPGVQLSQAERLGDGSPVALVGRVYCLADASHGPIRVGDALTTSATPGHAMAVTDYAKAQGAIIGKALSPLPEGKGLVLMVVMRH